MTDDSFSANELAELNDWEVEVRRPSVHHVQLRQDGKVFADWWPSKGTTMRDGKRGPKCKDSAALMAWLKTDG